MKLIDKIMRKLGFENINNIIIKNNYQEKPPKEWKMNIRRNFYNTYKEFYVPIVIQQVNYNRWFLIDGYTSYLIAKEKGIKYIPVERK